MSCKYTLLFLFLCGFAALSVLEECNQQMLEGTSCTMKLPTRNIDKNNEIKWVHLSGDVVIYRKKGKIKTYPGLILEEDGSLKFERVNVKNTGKYRYTVDDTVGTQIDDGEKEITVYAKAPKPTLSLNCQGGVKLICEAKDRTDLTFSWYKDSKIIQNEKNSELVLSSEEVKDNKLYTCSVSNPVSSELSDRVTGSCTGTGTTTVDSDKSLVPSKLFGFDFWIMVSILAGGGTLLLLLLCVLLICACRSCKQKKQQEDEDELRLRVLDQNGTARSKHTARGQPAPPIPQEDLSPPTPTQTQAQPKTQVRGRPPPPPEDDDEDPPPLPRPRNKQHRKRHEEPYRPME